TEDGEFKIYSNKRRIKLPDLSSGEKHIITILGRATLSNKDGAVFVADEPELSLHLDWQRKILTSIKKLSPLSQIIVATHSPAIFTKGTNQINLEDCK
ncbi:ATP-binding protein, partial [Citrobacter cronae]